MTRQNSPYRDAQTNLQVLNPAFSWYTLYLKHTEKHENVCTQMDEFAPKLCVHKINIHMNVVKLQKKHTNLKINLENEKKIQKNCTHITNNIWWYTLQEKWILKMGPLILKLHLKNHLHLWHKITPMGICTRGMTKWWLNYQIHSVDTEYLLSLLLLNQKL